MLVSVQIATTKMIGLGHHLAMVDTRIVFPAIQDQLQQITSPVNVRIAIPPVVGKEHHSTTAAIPIA